MINIFRDHKLIALLILMVLVSFLLSLFVIQVAIISGQSMEPTYGSFSFALINKLDKCPERGDVISIKKDDVGQIVKRVYAVGGDTVAISENELLVNGNASLTLSDHVPIGDLADGYELVLNDNEYFVLGDNLLESRDSRYSEIGLVYSHEITGTIIPNLQKSDS